MTPDQIENEVIQLIHVQPFVPFQVEFADGNHLDVPHPRLAINGGGAVFLAPDGALVDFEFKSVRAIRLLTAQVVS
ncbi:MAG: hypothetical protein ACKV2Q_28445 [Planctomycetaceae bacterium]